MKNLITAIAAVLLVGCGESQQTTKAPDTRLHKAAWDGNINDVKQYLTAGMDVDAKDADGETPLMNAARVGHKEIVELLIEKGADVNAKSSFGATPLHKAGYGKETEVAELLIANGADAGGILIDATWSIQEDLAETLILAGADVNVKGVGGNTPLHYAAQSHKEIAELLIDKGADVNAKRDNGTTPLDAAIHNNKVFPDDDRFKDIIPLLRKHGGKTGDELKAEGK